MGLKETFTRLAGASAAIACGATLLAGGAASAQAAPAARAPQAVNYQVANGNNRNACLQVSNTSGGKGDIVLGTCDRSAKQVWRIAGGVFSNPASGHCLDGNGADVYTHKCNGGKYQKWSTTSGSPKYIKHTESGRYLHASGKVGSEVGFQPTTGTSSRWVITKV
ncbi:ricin-type beta-trefoil lectin domain protein [Streptomyces sp. NPDC093085]|uniref:RICIN domain-containing protein n=1 Tax=Streptomyces sp. NPDC093085 TaxID=3155068 RepID=UPI00341ACB30